jgi:hypothetical protein
MAKQEGKGGAAGKKKKKSVVVEAFGQAHIQATFNNLIISLTNNKGEVISWSSSGKQRIPRKQEEYPIRRPIERRGSSTRGTRVGLAQGEGLRERPRWWTRKRYPRTAQQRCGGDRDRGHHPDAAQRLPPTEETPRLIEQIP